MAQGLRRLLRSIAEVREGEGLLTFLMFSYFFLAITAYYILKPVRNALFLDTLGAEKLPYVYMATALLMGGIVSVYSRLVGRLRREVLISASILLLLSNLVAFWWILRYRWSWVPFAFYLWVNIFSTMVVAQFWIFATDLFNPREAKRLFGLIGGGGLIGGATGGFITSQLVGRVGTENLLLVSGGSLLLCVLLVNLIARRYRHRFREEGEEDRREARNLPGRMGSPLALIARSRHLRLLFALVLVGLTVATFIDYQFNTIVDRSLPTKEAKTAYFGVFFSSVNVISFTVQFLVTGTLLRRYGLGLTLLLLPGALLGTAIFTLVNPVLWTGSLAKLSEGSLRYSIDRASREILNLPLSSSVRNRTKPFIDMVGERLAKGIGGVLLLGLTTGMALGVRPLSAVTLGLIGLWVALAIWMRREYPRSLRANLRRGIVDAQDFPINLRDPATVGVLLGSLGSGSEPQILYALRLLEQAPLEVVRDRIPALLKHPAPAIRAQVVRMLYDAGDQRFLAEVEGYVEDEDLELRIEAIHYVCDLCYGNSREVMEQFLQNPDPGFRVSAAVCMLHSHPEDERVISLATGALREVMADGGAQRQSARLLVAEALGHLRLRSPLLRGITLDLLSDPALPVRLRTLESLGQMGQRDYLPILIDHLADRRTRRIARQALARFGHRALGTLHDYHHDPDVPLPARKEIPSALALMGSQEAADLLAHCLDQEDPGLRYAVIKALNKIRARLEELRLDRKLIEREVRREAETYYRTLLLLAAYTADGSAAGPACRIGDLLCEALQERATFTEERISRLLGLLAPRQDVYRAYLGLRGRDAHQRANAIELLDTLLPARLRRLVLPIWDDIPFEDKLRRGRALFRLPPLSRAGALRELIDQPDRWLKVCAIYAAGELGVAELRTEIQGFTGERDPLVRETAEVAQRRLAAVGAAVTI